MSKDIEKEGMRIYIGKEYEYIWHGRGLFIDCERLKI
jgi:hypothetical protein